MAAASSPGPSVTREEPPGTPPPAASVWRGSLRLLDYWAVVYRRTWKASVFSSFLTPLLYVLAMGVLLGGFIEANPDQLGGATSYLAFVVPGMVAAQAMTTVFGEVTYPVMAAIKWQKTYYSMIATSLGVPEVVLAHLAFVAFRVATTCGVFLLVMLPFGVFESWWGVLAAFPVQVLVGLSFAAPIYAISAGLEEVTAFGLFFRLGMIPMFLFSGAFFPVENLSAPLEALARITPLWHGVDLTRMLVLGQPDASWVAVHLVYLLALTAAGWLWALRRLRRRMIA